jgi:hypothetical protein
MQEKTRFISLVAAETVRWTSLVMLILIALLTYGRYVDHKKTFTPEDYSLSKITREKCTKEYPPEKWSWYCNPEPKIEFYNKSLKDFFYDQKKFIAFSIVSFIISFILVRILSRTNFTKIEIHGRASYLSTLIMSSINKINLLLINISLITIIYLYFFADDCGFPGCAFFAIFLLGVYFIPYSIFSFVTFKLSQKFKFDTNYSAERSKSAKTFAFIVFCVTRYFLFYIFYNLIYSAFGIEVNSEIIMGTFFLTIPIYYIVLYRNLIRNTEIINNNITTTPEIDKILENVANKNNQ